MLKDFFKKAIEARGALSVATYMKQCLTHPEFGYYMKKDPFGQRGDFVTSPEISQMFGELVGINVLTQWLSMGKPSSIRLIEFGPGRGTLMDDLLRASKSFPDFFKAVEKIEFVEASEKLSGIQKSTLSKYQKPLNWYRFTEQVPVKDVPTFIIAHEFFDALPIHQYENTEKKGWQQRIIKYKDDQLVTDLGESDGFENSFIKAQPRYASLGTLSQIEVSPDTWSIAAQMSKILNASSGGALVVDYGPLKTVPSNTFRGFKDHKQVDPFEDPGNADLTADVDFGALKDIFQKNGLHVDGPERQDNWLHAMGIGARATVLHNAQQTPEGMKRIETAYQRLVDPMYMGKTYKVLAASTVGPVAGFDPKK